MKFYKRTVLYLLILCILITGVACSNSSESVDSDIEVQKNSEHKSSNSKNYTSNKLSLDAENLTFFQHAHPITETENGYFILLDSILHYMDKETKTFVVFSNDSISPEEINNDLRIFLKTDNGRSYSHEAYFPGACSIFYHNEKSQVHKVGVNSPSG